MPANPNQLVREYHDCTVVSRQVEPSEPAEVLIETGGDPARAAWPLHDGWKHLVIDPQGDPVISGEVGFLADAIKIARLYAAAHPPAEPPREEESDDSDVQPAFE